MEFPAEDIRNRTLRELRTSNEYIDSQNLSEELNFSNTQNNQTNTSEPTTQGTSSSNSGSDNSDATNNQEEPSIQASDSDSFEIGGTIETKDFFSKGTCIDQTKPNGAEDYCEGTTINEYYLDQDSCKLQQLDCLTFSEFYAEGSQLGCYDGSCVLKERGYNLTHKDYSIYGSGPVTWDECTSNTTVKEYYLSNLYTFLNQEIDCTTAFGEGSICTDGACTIPEQEAHDTDGGINITKTGTCTDMTGSYSDYCTQGFLVEYVPNPNNISECMETNIICPYGICSFGSCIPYDFDAYSDNQYTVESACSDPTGMYSDTCNCLNSGETCYYLKERILANNQCSYQVVDCRNILGNETAYCSENVCIIPEVRPTR